MTIKFSAIGVLAYATLLLAACDRAPCPPQTSRRHRRPVWPTTRYRA
jgi:hypothetical protein